MCLSFPLSSSDHYLYTFLLSLSSSVKTIYHSCHHSTTLFWCRKQFQIWNFQPITRDTVEVELRSPMVVSTFIIKLHHNNVLFFPPYHHLTFYIVNWTPLIIFCRFQMSYIPPTPNPSIWNNARTLQTEARKISWQI